MRTRTLLLCAALVACGSEPSLPEVSAPSVGSSAGEPERVATARVRRGDIASPVIASGSIAARRTTALGPSVPGRILQVQVDVGSEVATGDPLFQIDPDAYRIALEEANAGLDLARAERAEAEENVGRLRTLAEKKMVSEQEYERVQTRAAMARARVEQAESRRTHASHDLNRTLVRAPYAGTIVERAAHEGTMATVTPNTTVVVLIESGALEARLDIPEASLANVRPGDRVRLSVEGIADPFESTVRTASDRINPASRTYEVRVPLEDPLRRVKAGAFVRAEVAPRTKQGALVIERAALASHDGRTIAFRVADGRAERVEVTIGVVAECCAEVLAGLAEGDEVVVGDAIERLSDGARVEAAARAESGLPDAARLASRSGDEAR